MGYSRDPDVSTSPLGQHCHNQGVRLIVNDGNYYSWGSHRKSGLPLIRRFHHHPRELRPGIQQWICLENKVLQAAIKEKILDPKSLCFGFYGEPEGPLTLWLPPFGRTVLVAWDDVPRLISQESGNK